MSKLDFWRPICLVCVFCAVSAIGSPAQTFTTLVNFDGTNGANPNYLSLIQGTDGIFYGTTYEGGASTNCVGGCGTVFKITPGGALTTLHSFDSTDGAFPYGLIQSTGGNFYGVTFEGGSSSACSAYSVGCGTVFEISPTGTLTTLHSFDGSDGSRPLGALVQATNGNFYGTTYTGGANASCTFEDLVGCGTVFKITPGGTLTTLHNFDGADGSYILGGLVQGTNGDFYGTADGGGANDTCIPGFGCGTVFKITPAGTLTTLHSFDGTDGAQPNWLVQAAGGFYGTTTGGGTNGGYGTVFKITPAGTLTTLHSFDGTDGSSVDAGLVQGTDGSFYGTTGGGGASSACTGGCGTAFKITPGGTLTTLHSFDSTDGAYPSGLLQGTNGIFYGTTTDGGTSANCTYGCGTVFNLGVGLGPFVETLPTSGKLGTPVRILGTNLTGATSVTFSGTPAFFKVRSSSEIGTVVPPGATTGPVQVVTPNGTLTSNVNFRVE